MVDMTGRVCLVTGSTHGIGLATATALARAGATLVLHGRDRQRLETVVRVIRETTGNQGVSGLVADFSSLAGVRELARAFSADHPRLHVLVNNAGSIVFGRPLTSDGFEWHFGVNHLAPFLLTNLLLGTIKASAPSRVVFVSSAAHLRNAVHLDDLNFERGYNSLHAYGRSKFGNLLCSMELARRLAGTGVTVNALHPGLVNTNIGANVPTSMRWILMLMRLVMISPEQGAETSVYLATSPEVASVTGKYFVKCREAAPDPRANDAGLARGLWEKSAALTGLADAR